MTDRFHSQYKGATTQNQAYRTALYNYAAKNKNAFIDQYLIAKVGICEQTSDFTTDIKRRRKACITL